MRSPRLSAAVFLLSFLPAAAAFADPAAGTWQTEAGGTGGHLHVTIAPCGAALCGTIARAVDASGREVADYAHAGKRMLWDMAPDGAGGYRGGRIWAPDRDRTYNSRMTLEGDRLTVEGCVLGFCRGQVWRRVE